MFPSTALPYVLRQIPVLWPLLGKIATIGLSSNDFVTEPEDDFSDDRYTGRFQLGQRHLVNGAINTLNVIYTVQRWLKHLTREDEATQRWGSRKLKLLVDLLRKPGSFHHWFADAINLGSDETGRGVDTWDDSVIVHEMHHWIFDKSVHPFPPFGLDGGDHQHDVIRSKNGAITEGYAEYAELFWGAEYASSDRIRGYAMSGLNQFGSRLGTIDEKDDKGKVTNTFYLFGGPSSAAVPTFNTPNKGLEVEGYFANTLYQVHHALAEPGILFADAPTYWHAHNSFVTTEQSRRFSGIMRKALRAFPNSPTSDQRKQGTELYMKQLLDAALRRPVEPGPGGAVDFRAQQPVDARDLDHGRHLRHDAWFGGWRQRQLEGDRRQVVHRSSQRRYRETVGGLQPELPGNRGSGLEFSRGRRPQRGSRRRAVRRTQPGHQCQRDRQHFLRGAAALERPCRDDHGHLPAGLRPRCHLCTTTRGDDLETTLRKLYLYELRAAAKIWAGPPGNNLGALVTKAISLHVQAP